MADQYVTQAVISVARIHGFRPNNNFGTKKNIIFYEDFRLFSFYQPDIRSNFSLKYNSGSLDILLHKIHER